MIVIMFITMILLNSIQMLFIEDNKSGWTKFLDIATDFEEKKIVLGRYMSGITIGIFANLLFTISNISIFLLYNPISIQIVVLLGIVVSIISILYILLLVPFTYLFDQNGIIFVMIFFFLSLFLISRVNDIDLVAINFVNETGNILLAILGIAGLIIIGCVSYGFSTIIYNKRFINQ